MFCAKFRNASLLPLVNIDNQKYVSEKVVRQCELTCIHAVHSTEKTTSAVFAFISSLATMNYSVMFQTIAATEHLVTSFSTVTFFSPVLILRLGKFEFDVGRPIDMFTTQIATKHFQS